MTTAISLSDFADAVAPSSQPDLLLSAALHLMSHYSTRPGEDACLKLACVIERHLKALAALPRLSPLLQDTCMQLAEQWASHIDACSPRPAKPGLLARALTGTRAA